MAEHRLRIVAETASQKICGPVFFIVIASDVSGGQHSGVVLVTSGIVRAFADNQWIMDEPNASADLEASDQG